MVFTVVKLSDGGCTKNSTIKWFLSLIVLKFVNSVSRICITNGGTMFLLLTHVFNSSFDGI
ncbi:unnamed protein product [Schistosoma margrebowiei]|uniref:Uncharacterized protein n=1 Tax=Schistosoma margrebowiei TaxID=48269 RepID=A0A183LYD6_9TREM|nr:unnamed protein product [Schistosoma margrebowiei]